MDSLTSNYDVVITLLISGILGALGQGIRVWFGLSELIYNKNSLTKAAIASSSKSGSIFMGFVAGIFIMLLQLFPYGITVESAMLTIGTGYGATDFMEDILRKKQAN